MLLASVFSLCLMFFRHHCLLCFHIRKILKIMGVCFYFSLIFNQHPVFKSPDLFIFFRFYHLAFVVFISIYSARLKIWESCFFMTRQLSNMRMGVPLCISATAEKCLDDFCHQNPCNIEHVFFLSFKLFLLALLSFSISIYASCFEIWDSFFIFSEKSKTL